MSLEAGTDDGEGRSRFWRAILTALATLIAGPPIGGFLLMIAASILSAGSADSLASALHDIAMAPFVGVVAAPVSYIVGGIPAALAGLIVGLWVYWRGTLGYVSAASIAALACLAFIAVGVVDNPEWLTPEGWARNLGSYGWMVGLSIATALVLRWIYARVGLVR